jgi:phosphoglycerol transferase MdoB-like AlkP superfamily enzyme
MLTSHRGGGTSDCEFSLVNSVEPLEDRPAIMWNSYQYSNSFVKQLKKSGYACVAFHGNTGKFWNRSAAFLRMGYDAFEDTGSMGLPQDGWGVPDGPVLDLVLRTMKTQKRPFFFHVITMSSHEPYVNVPRYFTNSAFSGVRDDATRRYYLSMNYVDRCLEGFVTALLRDPTVTVLVMGDHCPVDLKGYAPARFEKAGRSFEFVPLFVAGRNVGTSGTPGRAASVLDLAPTILGLSGAGFAIRTDGDSLADGSVDVSQVPVCGVSFDRAELVEDLLAWRNRR